MNPGETTGRKIWNVIYPILALFAIYFGVVYGGMFFFASACTGASTDAYMNTYFPVIVIIALVIIGIVEYFFFRNDHPQESPFILKKPIWFLPIIALGAIGAHGLSLLVSLINTSGFLGSYEQVQQNLFGMSAVFVVIRVVILAPLVEELVFRGLVFRRMKAYTSFWPAALVSSALFGLYHLNLVQGIYAFLFAILICAVYEVMDNLWAVIALHVAANLLSAVLTFTGAAYPTYTIGVIAMAAALMIGGVLAFVVLKKGSAAHRAWK